MTDGSESTAKEPGRGTLGAMAETLDASPLDITCPRCLQPATVRFYGPCEACRAALRDEQGSDARAIETEAYEPKMNVTPNAVALKD